MKNHEKSWIWKVAKPLLNLFGWDRVYGSNPHDKPWIDTWDSPKVSVFAKAT